MSRLAATLLRARSRFTFDADSQRYRESATGKFVRASAVKAATLRVVNGAKQEIAELARQVATGELEISAWQTSMASALKALHLAAEAASAGGFPNMTAARYGRVGAVLRFVYDRLTRFAVDIEEGRLTAPRIIARAELYGAHAAGTFEAGRRYGAEQAGKLEERSVLGDAEHCESCVREAMRGWVPIGELVPIGERQCVQNCRCSYLFR